MSRYKLKVIFSKTGSICLISHLDLYRVFLRALRRSRLPVWFTEGFSPLPKISFKRALKLGVESPGEEAIFHFRLPVEPQVFKERLIFHVPVMFFGKFAANPRYLGSNNLQLSF